MPGAWDDERLRAEDGHTFDAPLGADALFGSEELEHELALAAALDRSRPSLSPDAQASDRMRRRLFEAMAAEEFGFDRSEQGAIRRPAPAPGPSELTAPLMNGPIPARAAELTAPLMDGPIAAERSEGHPSAARAAMSTVAEQSEGHPSAARAAMDTAERSEGVSVGRAAGEHTVASESSSGTTRSRRRARHVLPADHPDHAEQERPARGDRSRPPRGANASGPSASGPKSGRRRPSLKRRFGVMVTAVAALAVLAGVATTMSKNALPGDALYGVKRVTESTGGLLTFGDQAEATRQLDIARTRMDEIQGLLQRGDASDSAAITTAMDDFDSATSSGSRAILSADRTSSGGGAELADLRTWAAAQSSRMSDMRSSLPEQNASDADESMALLDRVLVRTEALRARTGCAEPGTASVDDLGPLPSTEPCTTAGGGPATAGPDGTTDGSTAPGSSEPGTSSDGTTPPGTSSNGTTPNGTTEQDRGLLPPLLGGDPARSSTGGPRSSSGSSTPTTSSDEEPLSGITLPPLLPGLGPVTIG